MLETRRKFKRFNILLGVKFKPTYGAKDYFSGISSNISCEGMALTADDFRFILYEYLELIIRLPGAVYKPDFSRISSIAFFDVYQG